MDRAVENPTADPIPIPPDIAAAILDIGLAELSPADILLQQFEHNRAWDQAELQKVQEHSVKMAVAATGHVDPVTKKWVTGKPDAMGSTERANNIMRTIERFITSLRCA